MNRDRGEGRDKLNPTRGFLAIIAALVTILAARLSRRYL
jgi:hypothetical protein